MIEKYFDSVYPSGAERAIYSRFSSALVPLMNGCQITGCDPAKLRKYIGESAFFFMADSEGEPNRKGEYISNILINDHPVKPLLNVEYHLFNFLKEYSHLLPLSGGRGSWPELFSYRRFLDYLTQFKDDSGELWGDCLLGVDTVLRGEGKILTIPDNQNYLVQRGKVIRKRFFELFP